MHCEQCYASSTDNKKLESNNTPIIVNDVQITVWDGCDEVIH